jgi:3-oxoacyl-[acyl-carrier protein] reductase
VSGAGFDLEERVVLVTGGRSGIGAAIVSRLRAAGALAASLDVAGVTEEADDRRLDLTGDVRDGAAVGRCVQEVEARFGGLDGLVQCAGITADAVLWKLTDAQWDDVLDVNLGGAFRVMRAVAPLLRARGGGSIVNVTSINGLRGKFGQSNYAASKAGLIGLTKTAARELGAFGVRVNAVAPGMVRTAMTASLAPEFVAKAVEESVLNRIAEPDDVADAVLFLLSDRARQITGTTVRVDAGQCI